MITAANPVIINCLIDMRGIESILIIKVGVVIECGVVFCFVLFCFFRD